MCLPLFVSMNLCFFMMVVPVLSLQGLEGLVSRDGMGGRGEVSDPTEPPLPHTPITKRQNGQFEDERGSGLSLLILPDVAFSAVLKS